MVYFFLHLQNKTITLEYINFVNALKVNQQIIYIVIIVELRKKHYRLPSAVESPG